METIISAVRWISDQLATTAATAFEEQKKILYEPSKFNENKPLIAKLWDIFIIAMVVYFIKSILDAQVQEKAVELVDSKEKK
jgi:hypothetical protein